jgi:hypothetical protein
MNGVPIPEFGRQITPFATVRRHIENGANKREIVNLYIAPLPWQQGRDYRKLFFCYFHGENISYFSLLVKQISVNSI